MARKSGISRANIEKIQVVDAIALLKAQHRDVEKLFAKIEKTRSGKGSERKGIFAELALKIDAHAKIEEKFFYPEGRDADEDMTLEAYEEHDVVRSLIRKIKATSPADETYMAKVTVLKELIEHHVEEEEEEYFGKVRKDLGDERIRELGSQMKKVFDKLVGEETPTPRSPRKVSRKAKK